MEREKEREGKIVIGKVEGIVLYYIYLFTYILYGASL